MATYVWLGKTSELGVCEAVWDEVKSAVLLPLVAESVADIVMEEDTDCDLFTEKLSVGLSVGVAAMDSVAVLGFDAVSEVVGVLPLGENVMRWEDVSAVVIVFVRTQLEDGGTVCDADGVSTKVWLHVAVLPETVAVSESDCSPDKLLVRERTKGVRVTRAVREGVSVTVDELESSSALPDALTDAEIVADRARSDTVADSETVSFTDARDRVGDGLGVQEADVVPELDTVLVGVADMLSETSSVHDATEQLAVNEGTVEIVGWIVGVNEDVPLITTVKDPNEGDWVKVIRSRVALALTSDDELAVSDSDSVAEVEVVSVGDISSVSVKVRLSLLRVSEKSRETLAVAECIEKDTDSDHIDENVTVALRPMPVGESVKLTVNVDVLVSE